MSLQSHDFKRHMRDPIGSCVINATPPPRPPLYPDPSLTNQVAMRCDEEKILADAGEKGFGNRDIVRGSEGQEKGGGWVTKYLEREEKKGASNPGQRAHR